MKQRQTGFTLVELMITLAVGIIILSIGIPAFNTLMAGNRATGYANDLVGALRLARSEAVKRGEGVTICASNAGNDACSASNWQNGWLVFTDPDNDRAITEGDTLIRVWQSMEGGAAFSETTPETIRFLPSGELSGDVNDIEFKLNRCSGKQARTISISRMGRAEITHIACSEV
jgi:type IV fimbrial biogenesis protein FimT